MKKSPVKVHSPDCPWRRGKDCNCNKDHKIHHPDCEWNMGHDCDCGLQKNQSHYSSVDEQITVGNTYSIPLFDAGSNRRERKDVVIVGYHKPTDMVHFKHKGKPYKLKGTIFKSRFQKESIDLDERVKMGNPTGLVNYKAKESPFSKGEDVRIPAAYHTGGEVHSGQTISGKFVRQGENFHHVDINGEDVAVPKHHVFSTNLNDPNYSEKKKMKESLDEEEVRFDKRSTIPDEAVENARKRLMAAVIRKRKAAEKKVNTTRPKY